MKYQVLFSRKNNSNNKIEVLSAAHLLGSLRIKQVHMNGSIIHAF